MDSWLLNLNLLLFSLILVKKDKNSTTPFKYFESLIKLVLWNTGEYFKENMFHSKVHNSLLNSGLVTGYR